MRETVYTVLEARGRIPVIHEERRPTYEFTVKPVAAKGYPPSQKLDASDALVFTRLLSDLSEAVNLIRRDVEEQHSQICCFGQAYARWRDLNPGRTREGKELFLLETLYAFLANLLLVKIGEGKGLMLLNQGPPDWEQMQSAISAMVGEEWLNCPVAECYSWYAPRRELLALILNRLETYDFRHVDRDILGKLYERCVPVPERKRLGLFTTPEVVVDRILEAVGYTPEEAIEGKTLLDPACGPGAFLVRAVRVLLARCQRLGYTAEETLHQVQTSLFGMDIVPLAVYLARLNVLAQVMDLLQQIKRDNPLYRFHGPGLFVADALDMRGPSLFGPLHPGRDGTEAQELKHRQGRFARGLDFVVGNPPYGKASHLGEEQLAYFAPSVYGHPNYYGLFLQLGIDLLAEGGRLGYIVPSSMTSGLYFKNLREYIVSRTVIRSVINIFPRQEVFDDVLQGVMILALERRPIKEKPVAVSTAISEVYSLAELSTSPRRETVVQADRVLLRKNGQLYFIFRADSKAHDIIARFFSQGHALSSPQIGYKARTGPIVWNRVKDYLRDSPADRCLPLIWSNNVSRYSFAFEGNRFGRQAWALRGPKTEPLKVSQPAILVQRTTAREQPRRLVAAYPTAFFAAYPEFFVENHLNTVASVRGSNEVAPEYILALLNSMLYDFAFRCLNGNTQVSASELDTFPVVLTTGQSLFIEKVQKIVSAPTTSTRAQVEWEIDQMVFDLFGLTQPERDFVLSHYPGQRT